MVYSLQSKCIFIFVAKKANTFILILNGDFAIDEEEELESNGCKK